MPEASRDVPIAVMTAVRAMDVEQEQRAGGMVAGSVISGGKMAESSDSLLLVVSCPLVEC